MGSLVQEMSVVLFSNTMGGTMGGITGLGNVCCFIQYVGEITGLGNVVGGITGLGNVCCFIQ